MLQLVEQYKVEITMPDVVSISIFYHDSVYDSNAKNNEEKSAVYAMQSLLMLGLGAEKVELVRQFILATTDHNIQENIYGRQDLAYLLDFDLAILSAPFSVNKNYARQIRLEYKQYNHFAYTFGRIKVLLHFLIKPIIYQTAIFKNEKEQIARQNI